jgi:flagellar protein FliT
MSAVETCYNLTVKLISTLEGVNANNREIVIEKINKLLVDRAGILPSIKPPFSEYDSEIGEKTVQLNQTLSILLNKVKQEIQKDMNGLSKKKTSMKSYINPYSSLQTDGFFYDKRK